MTLNRIAFGGSLLAGALLGSATGELNEGSNIAAQSVDHAADCQTDAEKLQADTGFITIIDISPYCRLDFYDSIGVDIHTAPDEDIMNMPVSLDSYRSWASSFAGTAYERGVESEIDHSTERLLTHVLPGALAGGFVYRGIEWMIKQRRKPAGTIKREASL